jgi:hypothetical protein
MEYPEKFKEGFIKKIETELSKCEIIYNDNTESIWFINREKKYWYLEYICETNVLFWRPTFFNLYINIFSLDDDTFKLLISKWVEETLKCKVLSTSRLSNRKFSMVEETLKCKVFSTKGWYGNYAVEVEDTLKYKVLSTCKLERINSDVIDETLNYKVKSVIKYYSDSIEDVDETLLK